MSRSSKTEDVAIRGSFLMTSIMEMECCKIRNLPIVESLRKECLVETARLDIKMERLLLESLEREIDCKENIVLSMAATMKDSMKLIFLAERGNLDGLMVFGT